MKKDLLQAGIDVIVPDKEDRELVAKRIYEELEFTGGQKMPLVRIEIIKGKSVDYKKKLLDAVHVALMNAIQIEDWDRFQRLYEIEDELFERSESKTDKFTMIELTMFQGRTKEQKERIYEEIVKELYERLEIQATDVFIVIHEPPNENWGLAGKQR